MAIVRSTAFVGASIYEADPGQVTLGTTLKNIQGDASEILRRLTVNTDPDEIDHSGPGRGCVLGIPPVSQLVDRDLSLDGGGAKNGGGDASRLQFPWLILIPPGETEVTVEATFFDDVELNRLLPSCRLSSPSVFTTAVASSLDVDMSIVETTRTFSRLRATFSGCTSGIALLTLSCSQVSADYVIDGSVLTIYPTLRDVVVRFPRGESIDAPRPTSSDTVATVQTPVSTQALFFQEMDDTIFTVGEAITGWHTSRIDANLNALQEYTSGGPAWDAETYTHTESALVTPTRDRFRAFTRRTFSLEPIPKIPVASHNYGGIKDTGGYLVDPAVPASVAARKAFAPYATSSASTELGSGVAHCPDIPSGTMRWAVLVGQSSGVGFANVRAQVQMETSTASAVVTPVAVTGATHLGFVQGTGLAFAPDSSSRLRVFLSQAAGVFASLNYCLLAAAVWVEE